MFMRIQRGWDIVRASATVLRQHPKLILLPVASGLALAVLFGLVALTVVSRTNTEELQTYAVQIDTNNPLMYVVAFAVYFVCSFVAIFFNSALIFCALQAFAGQTPSLKAGLSQAVSRLPQILAWALVAATVGLLLNTLQNFLRDRLGFLGSLLGGLLEFSWAIVTAFVVPVVVVEGAGPVEAVKRSTAILRKTWGEQLAGGAGMGAISFLLMLPLLPLVFIGMAMFGSDNTAGPIAFGTLAAFAVAYIMALSLVFSTLGSIFRTGTYVYATTGEAPAVFGQAMMQSAFRPKK